MATETTAQDIIICEMCEVSPVQMHCNSCAANLCHVCVTKHISANTEKDHNMVIFKKKNTVPIFPKCKIHKEKNCEMMNKCSGIPVCIKCLASGYHGKRELIDLLEHFNFRKDTIKQETIHLENSVYPKYGELIASLEVYIKTLPQRYEKLFSEISIQGEKWHRKVDVIINKHKQDVEKMKTDDLATLKKFLEVMKKHLCTLRQTIKDNNELTQSNNIAKFLERESTSQEIWNIPASIDLTPPTFTELQIQEEQLYHMFGIMTPAPTPQLLSSMRLDEENLTTAFNQLQCFRPQSISNVYTTFQHGLTSIACISPNQVWVSGQENSEIKCFTLTGVLQDTIRTKTGNYPESIAIDKEGNLIFTDYYDRSINMVRKQKIQKILSLPQEWIPMKIHCTATNDLLIPMKKQATPSRVIRYSMSLSMKKQQVIQFDDQGMPLFSGGFHMFIADNIEKDLICVSDFDRVAILNQAGILRFRYRRDLKQSFTPRGIVINSIGNILVADYNNHCIHVIDQRGYFIRYIDNCHLSRPWDLSMDKNDTLYVAEHFTGKVKVIKYLIQSQKD